MNTEFEKFLRVAGGADEAAKILDCSLVSIRSIRNGNREVSKSMAKKIIDAFPNEFLLSQLLYPKDTAA